MKMSTVYFVFVYLRYALSTSLFLGMEVERQAFAELLARICYEIEQVLIHFYRIHFYHIQDVVII